MSDGWDGTERRAGDKRLTDAMADVRALRLGVSDLAEAVAVRTSEFQNVVRQMALLLAGLLIVLVAFSMWQVSRLNERLDHGHDLITCLLLVEPQARTAQTLVDCQRGR